MGPRAPGLVARWAAGGRRGEPRESISSWGVWTLEGTRGPGRLALGVGSACPRGGPPLARGEGLWAPGRRSQVGPGHSPVGGERWTDGRRRGGEAIREEGLGRCATRGGRRRRTRVPGGPWASPRPLGWRGGWCGSLAGVRARASNRGRARRPRAVDGIAGCPGCIYGCPWAPLRPGCGRPGSIDPRGLSWKVVWLTVEHPLDIYLYISTW